MRHALILGSLLLCLGCGDDDAAPDGGGDEEGITWSCPCWTENDRGQRATETFVRCSASDPTEMLTDQHVSAVEGAGLTGGCDPCEETDDECTLE